MTLCSLVDVCDFRLRLWPPLIWLIVPWLIISWLLGPYFIWIYVFHFWSTFIVFFLIISSMYILFTLISTHSYFVSSTILSSSYKSLYNSYVLLLCFVTHWFQSDLACGHTFGTVHCCLMTSVLGMQLMTMAVDIVFLCRAFNFRTSSLVLQIYIFLWIHMLSQLLCLNL